MTASRPAARSLAAATAALALPALLGLGAPATAAPPPGCTPNKVEYAVDGRHAVTVTHVAKARVPANTRRTFDGPVPAARVITSRFDVGGAADAATVHRLAQKAARKARGVAGLTLAKPDARTPAGPLDDGSTTFAASPKAVRYAVWHGSRVWEGHWSRSECGPTGNTSGAVGGRWTSFESVALSGAFNCDAPTTRADLRKAHRDACALAYR